MEAIFHKRLLQHYAIVDNPGTYEITVASNKHTLIDDGAKSRYLINLRAGTLQNLVKAVNILGKRNFCPFVEVQNCFMTGVIWANKLADVKDLPIKGERVLVTIKSENSILMPEAIFVPQRQDLQLFSIKDHCEEAESFYNLLTQYT